jgi:S1-C subfamily serine protease
MGMHAAAGKPILVFGGPGNYTMRVNGYRVWWNLLDAFLDCFEGKSVNAERVTPDFQHTGFNSLIAEFAMMLVAQKGEEHSSLGSGVIVGAAAALTARHVIEAFSEQHDGKSLKELLGEGQFSLRAIHFLKGGSEGQSWNVRQIYFHSDPQFTDIVFLRLEPSGMDSAHYEWRRVRMQLLPPPVGSIVAGFGYHSTETMVEGNHVQLNTNPYTTSGEVQEIHDLRRDSAMYTFPCFRTNARFDPAMSGGPVFSASGHLCGIISGNVAPDPDDPNGEHVSYVASLWPIMGIMVSFDVATYGAAPALYPAIEMTTNGILDVVDPDKIPISFDPATGEVSFAVPRTS